MSVLERMLSIMKDKNITASKLALTLNINKSVISMWKQRNTNPPTDYIVPICEFLGVSYSYLLTGNNDGSGNELTATNLLLEYKSMNEDEQEQFDKQFLNIYLKKQNNK